MCQAYEGERRLVMRMEEEEDRKGRPLGCDFQAGFFQCPNRFNRDSLRYARERIGRDSSGYPRFGNRFGWECSTCGTFYPERSPGKESVRESEAR